MKKVQPSKFVVFDRLREKFDLYLFFSLFFNNFHV